MSNEQISAVKGASTANAAAQTEPLKASDDKELGVKFLQLFEQILAGPTGASGTGQVNWNDITQLANVAPAELKVKDDEPTDTDANADDSSAGETAQATDGDDSDEERKEDTSAVTTDATAAMVTVKNTNQDTANADGDSAAAEQFVLNDGDGAQADVKADVKAQNPANAQGTAAGDAQAGFDDITNAATAKDPRIVTAKASDGNQNARTVKPAAPAANFELSDGADQGAGMSVSAGAAPANAASLAQGLGRNVQATANAEQMALLKAQAGMAAEPTQGGTASRSANGSAAVELPGLNGAQNLERFAAAKGKGTTQTIAKNDQEKMVEQVKEMLRRAAQNRDGNSISIRLNPAELGAMVVKVAERHGQIFARVTPENKEVESALRARVHEVTQALVQVGFRADQLHISIGRERTDAETLSFKDFQQHMPQFSGEKGDSQSGKEGNNPELPLASRGSAPQTNVDAGWVA